MLARPPKPSSTNLLPRGVRRALDAMRANVSRDWSVVDLAAAAGVSSRTLQRQFKMFLGKSPGAALRDIRFDCARRELLQSSTDAKVMDLALRCGFAHCGRFSIEYRRRYGETPSQTLKRQAVFTGVLATMPSFFASSRDRLTVVLEPIEASPENGEIARLVADELATALTRAGVAIARQPRSARYRLTGVMRGWSWQTRLTLRLIESDTGRHLWAHCADGAIGEDSAPREHLATRIAAAIQPCLRLAEIDRAEQKPDGELGPHDLALRAMPGVLSLDAGGNARALDLLGRAMELDPNQEFRAERTDTSISYEPIPQKLNVTFGDRVTRNQTNFFYVAAYWSLNEKWSVNGYYAHDFERDSDVAYDFELSRIFHRWVLSLEYSLDVGEDRNQTVYFNFSPIELLEQSRHGLKRY